MDLVIILGIQAICSSPFIFMVGVILSFLFKVSKNCLLQSLVDLETFASNMLSELSEKVYGDKSAHLLVIGICSPVCQLK